MLSLLRTTPIRLVGRAVPFAKYSAMAYNAPLLVSPKELQELKSTSDVAVLDASWHMPNSPRNARQEFLAKRIPGAHYLDLDEVASPSELGLKHMMPSGEVFARALENFGINTSSHVVLYDSQGVFSAPRALFMFRSFGHAKSSILNGGLPRWESDGLPTESGPLEAGPKSTYSVPTEDKNAIRSYEQMVDNSKANVSDGPTAELVLDARPRGRYVGSDPEPRPGLSSGHIPHSFSVPFNTFLQTNAVPNSDKTYTTFLSSDELYKKLVDAVGPQNAQQILEGKRNVTTTCGSGMTAGVLWLGLKLLAESSHVALYDESWTGYASRAQSEIAKGES